MNDLALKELKIFVEQAVRPVHATIHRKRRMREELLAHLVAIFEEESQRLRNDQAALAEAKSRFGNPQELTAQLQETVPRWNRLARLAEIGAFRGPHESWPHFAGRMTALTCSLSAAALLVFLPLVYPFGRPGEIALRGYVLLCVALLAIPLTVGMVLLMEGMYRALYRNPSCRSWRLATIYGLASLPFFPLLAFAWYSSLTGDLATSLRQFGFAWCFAPLSPVLFALLAQRGAEEARHHEEWESLEIGN